MKKPTSANRSDTRFVKGKSGNPRGAQTLLTPAIREHIAASLRRGCFFADACVLAGVKPNTARSWILKGDDGESPYDEFAGAVRKADAECSSHGFDLIMRAVESDPRQVSLIFRLFALNFPNQWRERKDVEINATVDATFSVTLEELGA